MRKIFITKRKINSLEEAMVNSDVFIGLSYNILTEKMLESMSKIQLFLQWQILIQRLIMILQCQYEMI